MAEKKHTHAVMKSSLAKALIESGVEHFDGGGLVSGLSDVLGVKNNFQATAPTISNQDFQPQISSLQGRQSDIYGQQQNLAQSLLAQSQGQGPNPAQEMLNQRTGQNVAQQGALMASQRGASANPALLARQAAMQGAGIQQNAIGQSAALQAQQQVQAQGALAQQQQAMINAALQGESIQQGGLASQNSAITSGQLGAQQINANTAAANQQTSAGILGGIFQGAGAALGFSGGGQVPKMADGGMMGIASYATPAATTINPFSGGAGGAALASGLGGLGKGLGQKAKKSKDYGDDMAALDEMDLGSSGDFSPAAQGMFMSPEIFDEGGSVPGDPEVQGNSIENDKIPALLSPGEIVLPRSVTQGPNMEKKALEFLRHLKSGKNKGYGGVADAKKMNCGGMVKR